MSSDGLDADGPPADARSAAPSATAVLWERRNRRIPAMAAAAALTGLDSELLRDAARVALAGSPEVAALHESMPALLRLLPTELTDSLERCVNEVRGPVVWAETIPARAQALGAEDLFVCRTVRRSFDCTPNRILVGVLAEVSLAGRAVRGRMGEILGHDEVRRVQDVSDRARDLRRHPRLVGVPPRHVAAREVARFEHSRHAERFTAVLAARRRVLQPFDPQDLERLTPRSTAAVHAGVLEVFEEARRRLGLESEIGFADGAMVVGPLTFRHPGAPGRAPTGVALGGSPLSDGDALWERLGGSGDETGQRRSTSSASSASKSPSSS